MLESDLSDSYYHYPLNGAIVYDMPIIDRKDGVVSYRLEGQSPSVRLASNRQKKVLRLFDVHFGPSISVGAAGWEISAIFSDEESRLRWRRYLFLTSDYGSESDQLIPYDPQALLDAEIPDNWSLSNALQQHKDELIANILFDGSPFDFPMPHLTIAGNVFVFTGKFGFGSRDACQKAVMTRGGRTSDRSVVSREVDFLVIGTKGSPDWKRGTYGNKIESALLSRREHGSPAIISEEHWLREVAAA
jgi:hypothetical protein